MSLDQVPAGKYSGTVQSTGVRENTRLDDALEAWAKITFNLDGATESITWSGLLLTKSGERNKKTFRCLDALGYTGDVSGWVMSDQSGRDVTIEIIDRPGKDGKVYKDVDWVNKVGGGGGASKSVMEKLKAAGLAGEAKDDVDPEFGF